MRKFILLTLVLITSFTAFSQDFSNKGKDFWVGYGYHQIMNAGNSQNMVLYFATDQVTNITITIPGIGYTQNLTSPGGNNVLTSAIIPKTVPDARLVTEGLFDKGIHITSDKPMVAYAHIYNASVSGATILYPTNTLGKEYYSINYKNVSNSNNANCFFYVVATDTGTTTIEIKPTGNTIGGMIAGNTYTINLTQGQIYNVMGVLTSASNPFTGVDLTGTSIKSISSGLGGCKRIAVFSGSGRISITCNSNSSSSDNYMVQSVPKSAWGKKYLTAQAGGNQANNIYRVCVPDPTTVVRINGVVTAIPGFYYEITATNQPQMIEADKPIMVAQYFTSQGACGNGNIGDPEVVYLSAVEQNINTVLWNATPNFNITTHWVNVVIPNGGTALSSFTFDGIPWGGFVPHPQDPNYSYLRLNIVPGPHIIRSDSGFNAIAYGFGDAESYGYNAGTNIKDLYQQIGVSTQYGIESTPSVCTNSPFKFKVSLPYEPDSMRWDFHNAANMLPNNNNVFVVVGPGAYDSTTTVNLRPVYWYSLPTLYSFTAVGTYPVTITTYAPDLEGCGTVQDIDFDLIVSDPPVPNFNWLVGRCVAEPVQFTETTPQFPKPTYKFWWDFGDPASGPTNISTLRNPTHIFSAPGTYNVRYTATTTPGCLTDTVTHQVTVLPLPSATISGTATLCINSPSTGITFTGSGSTAPYTFYYTITPGGPFSVNSGLPSGTTATITHNPTTAGTFIYTLDSIRTIGSTLCVQGITGQQVTVIVTPDATTTLTSAPATANQTVCVNNAIANITYQVAGSGTGANVVFTPALPGVTGTYAGGIVTIQGTPTISGTFTYTVTPVGPCINPSLGGTITVNADATITLSSLPTTTNQTVCINTTIANIIYQVGGSGTGANVVFTPALPGVTGTYFGGVFTIQGAPTVSGTFTYTVTTTGPCVKPSLGGTITVNADATTTLTSAPATTNQTVCVNNAIANITYQVGGGGTGANVVFTPALPGVTGTYAGGIVTIQGTPTISGTFTYTVTPVGPCINPPLGGTITVDADATITLSSLPTTTNQTVCINTTIANIIYQVGGGGTGASVVFTPALPGVTGTYFGGVFTIQGAPTVSGTFTYTVTTTGPCIKPSLGGMITVNANATTTLTSAPATANQTVCVNNAIANITYQIAGSGTGANVVFTPALPGVTGTYAGGIVTIQGTPTISGTFTYTVTPVGPCINPPLGGTITVDADATITLNSLPTTTNQTVCINTTIANIIYQIGGGGTGANVVFSPALPGVTGTYFGGIFTIQGAPTVSGTFTYTVTTTGPCIKPSLGGTITVNANATTTLTSAPATTNQTVCVNNAIANITYQIAGSGTGANVVFTPALPGVTGTYAGGIVTIQGTPTISGTFTYTVTPVGPCVNPPLGGTITVNADATITLSSLPATINQTVCINTTIANIIYQIGGGGTGANVVFTPALPGVTGTYAGGIFTIQGAPTVSGTFTYTVTTTGPCIKPALGGTITVNANATTTLTSAPATANQTVCVNNAIANITYQIAGSGTGANVVFTPALPGVTGTYAGGIVTIQGTPTISGTFTYTVTPVGPCINPPLGGTIIVNADATITLNSLPTTTSQTVCINTAIANIIYQIGGGGTGANVVFTPALPGVTGTYAGGIFTIQGSPTISGAFTYTVTTTGPCIKPSLSGTLNVTPNATTTLTSAPATANQTVCVNNAIANITYQIAGSGTGANVVFTPALPGVTGTYAGGIVTIQGTPTISGTFTYTVTPVGPCVNPPLGGTITVNADATITLSSLPATTNQTVCINTTIANITYQVGGGGTGANVVFTPALPGVTGTYAGGIFTIQGAPTVSGTFTYTVTTTGPCIKPSLGGTITVNANATTTLTSAPATTNQTVCVNNAIANITYLIAGSGTGANVVFTPALPGVTGTYAGGIVTIQGTPTISGTFTYTVTPVGPCINPPLGGTIIVNADATISLSSLPATTSQTVCINSPIANITYQIGGGGTGASVVFTPALPGVTGTYAGGVFTIQGSPTISGAFTYTVTTTGPCIKPALSGTLNVNTAPTATISGNTEVCQNAPMPFITFTGANASSPYTFTYSVNGGPDQTISTVIGNSSVTLPVSTAVVNSFTYTLKSVQDGSPTACTQLQSGTATVKVNPLPTATISGTTLVCINSTAPGVTFTGANGTTPYTFTYTVTGTPLPQTISTTGSNTSVTVPASTTTAGTFTYTLVSVQDGSTTACNQFQSGTAVVDVSNIFPNPDFTFGGPVCIPNAVVQFQNTSTISNGTPMTYDWTFGDGSPNSTAFSPSHQYNFATTFNVTLQARSNAGCIVQKTILINNIHPQPKADFSFNKPGVCIKDDVTVTDLSDGKDGIINQWHWNMGDGTIVTTNPYTHTYTDTLTYNVTLYTVNSFGCNSDTISKPFTVHPYPKVDAGPDRFILEGGQIVLSPVVYGNDLQFEWTPNQYLLDNHIEKVKVNKPLTDMTYTLKVTARGGCPLSDDVFIKLLKFPTIANTFTPNGDGINDTWRIDYLNTYPNNRVQIFTRTGQLVFESKGYNTPWDGTLKGKPLPFDTYYYIIEPGNGRDPITGYVTIIK